MKKSVSTRFNKSFALAAIIAAAFLFSTPVAKAQCSCAGISSFTTFGSTTFGVPVLNTGVGIGIGVPVGYGGIGVGFGGGDINIGIGRGRFGGRREAGIPLGGRRVGTVFGRRR